MKRIIKFFLPILVLITILIFINNSNYSIKKYDRHIYFLNHNIALSGYLDEELLCPIIFLADSKMDVKNEIKSISLIGDNKKISLSDWTINKGDIYKGYQINNLELKLIVKNIGNLKIDGLRINYIDNSTKDYTLDNFYIYGLKKTNEAFKINKYSAVSKIDSNIIELENISKQSIKIKNISFISPSIKIKDMKLKINNRNHKEFEKTILNPQETLNINIKL